MTIFWLTAYSHIFRQATRFVDLNSVSFAAPLRPENTKISDDKVFWLDKPRVDSHGRRVPPPRFLLGIMSHEMKSPREADRRQMIRDTYLKYFVQHGSPKESNRICSIHELVEKSINVSDCQIAYAFVVGQTSGSSLASNRTELLDEPSISKMIQPHPQDDVISLNIVENGKFGKSPTWFRFATLLSKENNLGFEYVIKSDSDTLLIPARFLRWIDDKEAKNDYDRTQIYGGTPLDKMGCGWPNHDHCEKMTAPYFHAGGFYFASMDVSEYIVSDMCPRSELFLPHEDVTMGNYVHSMPATTGKPIVGFKNPDAYQTHWIHPVKDPKRIRSLWRGYISKKKQRMKRAKNQAGSER